MRSTPLSARRVACTIATAGLVAGSLLAAPNALAAATDVATGTAPAAPAEVAAADATAIAKRLGAEAAGVYRDRATGRMVVNVTNGAAASQVRRSGATARLVQHSTAELAAVTRALGRSAKIAGTAWAVNPVTNRVEVSVDQSIDRAELARVTAVTSRFGDRVSVARVGGTLSPRISGGNAIYGGGYRCSLGFNVRSGTTYYFLTAGHCTNLATSWYSNSGQTTYLGPTVGTSFPGNDYGIVRHDGTQTHPGNVYLYGAGTQDITKSANAYVGEPVKRSGSTTGVHSGTVQALNATVNYAEGTVYGLIKTNVCAEGGDSGGSLYDGTSAIGLTSGGNGNCVIGGTTYFQPVTEALSVYGVSVY